MTHSKNRPLIVSLSLVTLLTLTSGFLLAIAPPPLTADSQSGTSATASVPTHSATDRLPVGA